MVNERIIFAGAAGWRGKEIHVDKNRDRRDVNVLSSWEKPCLLKA
jgi:hypothetical protein